MRTPVSKVLVLLPLAVALCQETGTPWPPQPLPQIVLRGSEHSGRFVEDNPGWPMHLVTLFVTEKNIDSAWHSPKQHLEWAANPMHSYVADGTGCFVIIAHPGRNQFEQIIALPALDAMEVSSGGSAAPYEELWDRVLTWRLRNGQKPIWGSGADDSHSITNIDRSWVALRLSKLTEAAVKSALRAGSFYVSNGPVITGIEVRGATLEVSTAAPSDIRWLRAGQYGIGPAVVSRDPGENHCLRIDRNVSHSAFTFSDTDGSSGSLFLRAIVTDGTPGKAAQTQPFTIRAGGVIENPYPAAGGWYKGMLHNHADYPEGSEEQIARYRSAYAAKGHSAAFETPYEYWLTPIAGDPAGRAPRITRVEPRRVRAGAGGTIEVTGSAFAPGARLLIDGRVQPGVRRLPDGSLRLPLPRSLAPGRYEVTVANPDGLQHTLQRALILQPRDAVNAGWTEFTPFNAKLGSLHTYAAAPDPRGGVWVATNNGISRFDGRQWSLSREVPEAGAARLDNTIYDLAVDAGGTLWFTCLRGVGALHPDGRRERWEWRAAGFPRSQVNQILPTGEAIYATMHNLPGLFALREGKWERISLPFKAVLNAIAPAGDGTFWLGTSGGVQHWEAGRGDKGWTRFTSANSGLPDDYVRRLSVDRSGALWVATATRSEKPIGGLARYDRGTWTVYDPGNSPIPERRVWDVLADSQGRVWAATSRGVACLLPGGAWRIYNTLNSGLADDLVTGIAEDKDGNLWFTTAYGVSRFKAGEGRQPGRTP